MYEVGVCIIVFVYFGCFKGVVDFKYLLVLVVKCFGEFMNFDVKFVGDVVGFFAIKIFELLVDGEIVLVENVCFEKGEISKDEVECVEFV